MGTFRFRRRTTRVPPPTYYTPFWTCPMARSIAAWFVDLIVTTATSSAEVTGMVSYRNPTAVGHCVMYTRGRLLGRSVRLWRHRQVAFFIRVVPHTRLYLFVWPRTIAMDLRWRERSAHLCPASRDCAGFHALPPHHPTPALSPTPPSTNFATFWLRLRFAAAASASTYSGRQRFTYAGRRASPSVCCIPRTYRRCGLTAVYVRSYGIWA